MQNPRSISRLVFTALLSSLAGFFFVAVTIERGVMPPENVSAELLLGVAVVLAFSAIALSHVLGQRGLEQARTLPTESERMAAGLKVFILRLGFIEGAGLMTLVFYLFTGEPPFLWLFAIVIIAFLLRKPSESEWDSIQRGS